MPSLTKVNKKGIYTSPPHVVLEDLSLLVPMDCRVGDLITALKNISPVVMHVQLGEEPRTLNDNMKSVFLHVSYHDPKKTLSSNDTKPLREKILKAVSEKFNGKLRT